MKLADMEELLMTVASTNAQAYMSEALQCYQASAFRACIVMCCVTLFDDIRAKVDELGKVNADAKKISKDVKQRIKDEMVFEDYLANQLGSKSLISNEQKEKLKMVLSARNKAAHPSGIVASAEEARFIFFETIDKFLSQPKLQTTHAADALISRLSDKFLFPSTDQDEVKSIVEEELSVVHEGAFPYLISKLLEERKTSSSSKFGRAGHFLRGMASMQSDKIRPHLMDQIIVKKSSDHSHKRLIMSMLINDPALADGVTPAVLARLNTIVVAIAKDKKTLSSLLPLTHPVRWLQSFIGHFGQDEVMDKYDQAVEATFDRYRYTENLIAAIAESGPIRDKYKSELLERAGSSQYDTANPAARALKDVEKSLGKSFGEDEAFELLARVSDAAEYGAWDSKELVNQKFKSIPSISAKAKAYGGAKPDEAAEILDKMDLLDLSVDEFIQTIA